MFGPGTGAPLELPDVDIGAAWAAVAALKSATTVTGTVLQQLSSGEAEQAEWTGAAADEYRRTKSLLIRELNELADSCRAMVLAVSDWADLTAPALMQLREIIEEAEAAQTRQRAQQAAGNYTDLAVEARINAAWAQYNRVGFRYLDACREAGARFEQIRTRIPERPWDLRDNVSGFVSTTWSSLVTEPVDMAWALTGDALVDPSRWWSTVTSTVESTAEADVQLYLDPVATTMAVLGKQLHLDAWRQQHFGEGVSAAATIWIVREPRLRAPLREKRLYFEHNMADAMEPSPPPVTAHELLNRVNLRASEHFTLGHAQRRHVFVDHFYQQDRTTFGTLLDDGTRSPIRPPRVSAWNDAETADRWVTAALQRREPQFLAWAASNDTNDFPLRLFSRQKLGEVMSRDGDRFRIDDGHVVISAVRKTGLGLYIPSAYLER